MSGPILKEKDKSKSERKI